MHMTSLLKSSINGSLGSSSEAVAEGARRATGETASEAAARRDPEVVAIAKRRQFSGSEKRRLLAEAERCKEAGTLGAFLRGERIYSSMIASWRKQVGVADQTALGPKTVSYTHLRAHETRHDLVCRLLLEKKKKK